MAPAIGMQVVGNLLPAVGPRRDDRHRASLVQVGAQPVGVERHREAIFRRNRPQSALRSASNMSKATPSISGLTPAMSCRCPGSNTNRTRLLRTSTSAMISVFRPPRDRPMAWPWVPPLRRCRAGEPGRSCHRPWRTRSPDHRTGARTPPASPTGGIAGTRCSSCRSCSASPATAPRSGSLGTGGCRRPCDRDRRPCQEAAAQPALTVRHPKRAGPLKPLCPALTPQSGQTEIPHEPQMSTDPTAAKKWLRIRFNRLHSQRSF